MFTVPTPEGITTGDSLLVEGNKIISIGRYAELQCQYPDLEEVEIIDCSNKIVMPGLLDGHNHLCNTHMNISRMFSMDYNHIEEHMLTTIHDPYGWLTEESLYDISLASLLNDVKHGATTIENSTIMPDTAFRVMNDGKIRGILAPQMATSFRLESDDLNWKEMLERTKRCLNEYHDPNGLMMVAVHVHDLWDTAEEMIVQSLELAEEYDTKYVTHFWEFQNAVDRTDALWSSEGGSFNHYMNRKLINDRCVLFHGSMLKEREIEQIAAIGASVIHNPDINGTNCGNCAYVPYMLKSGLNIGLGSDYGSLDVMTAMKLMLFGHNIMPRDYKKIEYWQPFEAATMGNAKAYGLEDRVGSLEEGKCADIITIDMSRASHLLPMATSMIGQCSEILYFLFTRNCAGTETSETMIDGKFIRKNGEFTMLDEERIIARASERCEGFLPELIKSRKEGKHYVRRIHPDFIKDEDIQHYIPDIMNLGK